MRALAVASALLMGVSFSGLAPTSVFAQPSNPLTPGNVTLNLAVGKTTQAEVLQVFGAPNIVTQDGSRQEVWSYQRHATVTQGTESSAYFSILLAGAGSSKSSKTQTQRTMTLIIKFDANRVVSDFSSRASEF
jgi:hypothetical protein